MCEKRQKHIAFLLGSGFSVPAGLPTANDLWIKILRHYYAQLKYEFESPSVMDKPQTDWWLFPFWKVLKQYQNEIEVNYEDFFDRLHTEKDGTVCTTCLRKFISENVNNYWNGDNNQSLKESLFNGWDCELLKNYEGIVESCINTYQNIISITLSSCEINNHYTNFVSVIKNLSLYGIHIDIFTLNHDLLVEKILQNSGIQFNDGFDHSHPKEIGKHTFYDASNNSYDNGNVNLYKLHGSIDLYKYTNNETIGYHYAKVIDGDCFMMTNETNFNLLPYFLTGTTTKVEEYMRSEYIHQLLSIFGDKLKKTNGLIVIGYSGNDNGINKIIYENYDNWSNMVIIAPDANKHPFVKDKQATPINKGIESLSFNDLNLHSTQ